MGIMGKVRRMQGQKLLYVSLCLNLPKFNMLSVGLCKDVRK